MVELDFKDMGLKSDLLHMINEKGFETPTPIQVKAIPLAMSGVDVMGQAQTGTGKTASFGIPILNKVTPTAGVQALIVCPTRELCLQVREEIAFLGRRMRIGVLAVYGGQSIELQLRGLEKGPEVIVATPGRLLDHLQRNTISLSGLQFVVLDEADEMLDMGFMPDIENIFSHCPRERQTFLFSATLVDAVREMGRRFMVEPREVLIEPEERTVAEIDHYFYEVNPRHKVEALCRIIDARQPATSLVFCRTKRSVDQLAHRLQGRGYNADALHGDMSQKERDSVMGRFRRGAVRVLVATDLAARGLDIDLVTHVFNYDLPEDPDIYIHRTGRTGRMGRTGEAITLIEPLQKHQLRLVERHIGRRIRHELLPGGAEAVEGRQEILKGRILQGLNNSVELYLGLADQLIREYDARVILAATLRLLDADPDQPEVELEETVVLNTGLETGVHVELPMGRLHGYTPRRLVEFLVANTSLTPDLIGEIEINSSSSYAEVPMERVDEIYESLSENNRRRKKLNRHKAELQARTVTVPPKKRKKE
ncbi:MAG TPA: DEAD/DEAH box helicase [Syntrophomonadaceae bacterium]|nr:DEAD/DEAH box helicase [Syntrophomonadaceae bacterium]